MDDLGAGEGEEDGNIVAATYPLQGGGARNTRVRRAGLGAILCAMSTDSHRIPAKPTLDGLEDKWTQRWAKEHVVQV